MPRYASLALLAVILAGGGFLRLWQLGDQSLWIDEAYTMNGAEAVIDHGYPLLDSGVIYTNTPLATYVTAAIMGLVPIDAYDPWLLRLPAAIFGIILIAASYFLSRSLTKSEWAGLAVAAIIAFSSAEIAWSRQIRGYAAAALFLVIFASLIWKYLRSDRSSRSLFVWSIKSLVFAALAHWVSLAFIPVALAAMATKLSGGKLKLSTTIWIILLLELVLFAIFVAFIDLNILLRVLHSGDIFTPGFILMTILSLVSMTIGLVSKEHRQRSLFLISLLILPIIPIIIGSRALHSWYFGFPFLPFAVILSVLVATQVSDIIFHDHHKSVQGLLLTILVLVFGWPLMTFWATAWYDLTGSTPQPDYRSAFSMIRSGLSPDDVVISNHPVLHRAYLESDGMWLPPGSFETHRAAWIQPTDRYTSAPLIASIDSMREIAKQQSGFIMIDGIMALAQSYDPQILERDLGAKLVYSSGTKPSDQLWIYRF